MNKIEQGIKEAKEGKFTSYKSVDELMNSIKTERNLLWKIQHLWYRYIWNKLTDLKWQIPTMWHRAFHGWGYADTWNLDAHLASVIYESLVYLKAHRYGTPIVLKNWKDPNGEEESEENEKMWKVIEDEMIYAFKLAKEIGMGEREFYLPGMDNKFRKELKPLTRDENRKMRKGMLLFVKYFFNLWD